MMRIASWPALHYCLAALVCLVIPAASWSDGSGSLAWTMYSNSASYRVRIAGYDADDRLRWISPSAIAARSAEDLKVALAGSEGFRHGPHGITLRARLPLIASLACALAPVERVELTLEERRHLDAPVRTTHFSRACRDARGH
jgi:hypothetical protein